MKLINCARCGQQPQAQGLTAPRLAEPYIFHACPAHETVAITIEIKHGPAEDIAAAWNGMQNAEKGSVAPRIADQR